VTKVVVESCEVKAPGFSSAQERARGGRATRLALAERLRDQTTVLEGSRICCSPPLAPGSAGQQAGFRMQHYESIGALGPSALVPSTASSITMLFAWLSRAAHYMYWYYHHYGGIVRI